VSKKRDIIKTQFGINLPVRTQIGGAVYEWRVATLRGKRTCAQVDYCTHVVTIDLAKHANLNDLLDTFWHEISHIIRTEFRTKMSHTDIVRDSQGRTQALFALVEAQ
jgi:hypothetical protein